MIMENTLKLKKSTSMALRQLIYKKKDEHDKDHRVDAQLWRRD